MTTPNVITTQASIGRRREARLRVRLDARFISLDGTSRAVLADISENGARLVGMAGNLRPGDEGILQWGGREAFGVVVWAAEGQFGISLYDPVPHADIVATREMDDHQRLPSEKEIVRRAARAFVQGRFRS